MAPSIFPALAAPHKKTPACAGVKKFRSSRAKSGPSASTPFDAGSNGRGPDSVRKKYDLRACILAGDLQTMWPVVTHGKTLSLRAMKWADKTVRKYAARPARSTMFPMEFLAVPRRQAKRR